MGSKERGLLPLHPEAILDDRSLRGKKDFWGKGKSLACLFCSARRAVVSGRGTLYGRRR